VRLVELRLFFVWRELLKERTIEINLPTEQRLENVFN